MFYLSFYSTVWNILLFWTILERDHIADNRPLPRQWLMVDNESWGHSGSMGPFVIENHNPRHYIIKAPLRLHNTATPQIILHGIYGANGWER